MGVISYQFLDPRIYIESVYQWDKAKRKMVPVQNCTDPATPEVVIVITVFIILLMLLGIVGNVATLGVIIKNKHLQTNFNRFLISLCASDLVSACICSPLWLYRRTWGFHDWKWMPGLCQFYWVTDFATDFTTSLHILSFCILRYWAFSRPFTAPTTKLSRNHFRMYIASLWVFSVALAAPHAYFMDVRTKNTSNLDPWPSCSIKEESKQQYHVYSAVIYSLFFYVPAVLVIILSFFTTRNLRKMTENYALSQIRDAARVERIRHRNKCACRQVRLICACFTMGYVPVAAYLIWTSAKTATECSTFAMDYWFGVASYLMLRVSECLNPVMYNLGCTEMRQATMLFLKNFVVRKASAATRSPAQRADAILSSIFASQRGSLPGEPRSNAKRDEENVL